MEIIDAIILGLIQGLTEFLPVSSSGHLEILSHFLGVNPETNLTFSMMLHGGTVLSTIVVFRKELLRLITQFFKFKMNPETIFVLKIFISFIPIVIVGLTLKDELESLFGGSLIVVGAMLIVTAILLWFTYRAKSNNREISYRDAFIIGIAQSLAVMPGLSRSGSTISTGLILGVKREEISKFSFLMVLIPIIGMNFLEIATGEFSGDAASIGAIPLIIGFMTSFLSGLFACKTMIALVNRGKLYWFSIYCVIVGLSVIIYSLTA